MSTQHRSHLASTPQRGPSHQPVAGPSTQQHLPSEDAYVSLDCEFVGVLTQGQLEENALAEVSLVDYWGNILYQSYCAPDGPVSDYRTWVSVS